MIGKKKTLREQLRDQAIDLAENARDKAGPVLAEARDRAVPVLTDARDRAVPVLTDARDKATPLIAEARATAAEKASVGAGFAAVRDWKKLQQKLRDDAAEIEDSESRELLHWFADGAMTLLGYEIERPGKQPSDGLGIFSIPGAPTDEGGCLGAMRYFENGGAVPLIAKAERKSTVHRRVPLDLIVLPLRENGKITGIGVYAGLWTSQALIVPAEEVPLLRRRLNELDKGGEKGSCDRRRRVRRPRGQQPVRDLDTR